jgi:FixJ family two-component response regulator
VPATVYVIHPDPHVRQSVGALADSLHVPCRSFAEPGDFLDQAAERPFGCLLTVAPGGEQNGVDLLDELQSRDAPLPVIMTSPRPDPPQEIKALRWGALDFLVNPDGKCLEAAIRRGLLAAETLRRQREQRESARRECEQIQRKLERLTAGERAVLDRITRGEMNKSIARQLDVSVRTVEQRRRNIMLKMEAHSLPQLVSQVTRLELLREMIE